MATCKNERDVVCLSRPAEFLHICLNDGQKLMHRQTPVALHQCDEASFAVFTINTDGTGMKHVVEGWDPMFVGETILNVNRPGPDYSHDQIYSSAAAVQLTHTAYNDAFEMKL